MNETKPFAGLLQLNKQLEESICASLQGTKEGYVASLETFTGNKPQVNYLEEDIYILANWHNTSKELAHISLHLSIMYIDN